MKAPRVDAVAVPSFTPRVGQVSSTAADRWILKRIQGRIAPARLAFVLWDGYQLPCPDGTPVATVRVGNRSALLAWVRDIELNFGDTYMFGDADIDGDLVAALEEVYRALPLRPRPWWLPARANDVEASRENVHRHYDLGNEFYRLWLDTQMLYTCAYFVTPDMSLEDAQIAKMDLICRKLRLKPGDRVLEAGCGWGALALHMARGYGATVRAFNVSSEQIRYARARAAAEGLQDRVEFVEDDYRSVTGEYDCFVSVGMVEHVGAAGYPILGRVIDRSLTARGRGLLHFIGRNRPAPLNAWIRKRIFPGAYPPALHELVDGALAPFDFSVLDVENLRLHYARTLAHWYARFNDATPKVAAMFDDAFVRAWRLYLAGAKASFTTGAMQLFQVVFARGTNNDIPWTRVEG